MDFLLMRSFSLFRHGARIHTPSALRKELAGHEHNNATTHRKVQELTLAAASPPYGGFSRAPLRAPSLSPPRNNCLICDARP